MAQPMESQTRARLETITHEASAGNLGQESRGGARADKKTSDETASAKHLADMVKTASEQAQKAAIKFT